MDRRYLSGAAATQPTSALATSAGFPTEGNLSAPVPVPPTVIGPRWFHQITEELVNVITDAGLTLDIDDLAQLRQAIDAKIAAAIADLVIPEGVSLATRSQHLSNAPPTDRAAVPEYVRQMISNAIANRITQAFADGRYLRSVPSEYLTQAEGDARYERAGDFVEQRWLFWPLSAQRVRYNPSSNPSVFTTLGLSDRLDKYRAITVLIQVNDTVTTGVRSRMTSGSIAVDEIEETFTTAVLDPSVSSNIGVNIFLKSTGGSSLDMYERASGFATVDVRGILGIKG